MGDRQPVSKAEEFKRLADRTEQEVENDEIDRTYEKQFDAWTYANRDLIARALRLLELAENPSQELLGMLSQAFARTKSRYVDGRDQLDEERALLRALSEAV